MLSTKNAGALISGRVRLTINKGIKMPEIKQITITRNTVAGGKAVEVGDVLTVDKDISESEALFLTQIKKAVSDVEAESDAKIDPSKMTGPDPENREADQEETIAKRGPKGKKK